MENAAKALTIAGGILIALMIIALLIYMVQTIGNVREQENVKQRQEQILAFNKEYESFDKTLMRGTDVITVINKANNNNSKNSDDPDMQINSAITITKSTIKIKNETVMDKGKVYSGGGEEYNKIINDKDDKDAEEAKKQFKRLFFKCTDITYNEDGRVNGISFEEVDVGDIPDY